MTIVIPPLMFALALLFWGWQSGLWISGIAAAAWLEWMTRTSRRWHLADKQIDRVVDLTSLALIAVALYQYGSGPAAQAIFTMLHWAPLLLLPLFSVQQLSGRKGIQQRALFYSQRNSTDPAALRELDLSFPYLAACLMSAGHEATEPRAYFPLLAVIITWLLWWNRSRERRVKIWIPLLVVAVALGYLGQMGLRLAQIQLEDAAIDWLTAFFSGDTDPYRANTALGDIGRLKLSDRILYRVQTDKPLRRPLLLRTASYNRYFDTTWLTRHRDFQQEQPAGSSDVWQWETTPNRNDSTDSAQISAYLEKKQSILPLPIATWRIEDLPVAGLSRHPFGAIKVTEGPELVRYRVRYGQAATEDAPPEEADLLIPKQERKTLAQLANRLRLTEIKPDQAMQRVRDYFRNNFRYTLQLPGKQKGKTALDYFLLERRRGHCEYFASATVLLLRQAGIPARYAVGYAVEEPDGRPNHYVVRYSHAHAWTLAWHDGKWWNLDTTPSVWYRFEAEKAPFWQPLLDLLSDLYYQYRAGQLEGDSGKQNPWLWALLILLFLALGYRLRPGRAFRHKLNKEKAAKERQLPTPMDTIEAVLERAGFPRNPWETHGDWLQRLRQQPELSEITKGLEEIRQLHYRFRYRDERMDPDEFQRMRQLAAEWLRRWDGQFVSR